MARITLPSGTTRRARPPARPARRTRGLVALARRVRAAAPLRRPLPNASPTSTNWAVCAVEIFPGGESLHARGAVRDDVVALRRGDKVADAEAAADACGCRPGRPPRVLHGRHVRDEVDRAPSASTAASPSTGWSACPRRGRAPDQRDAIDVGRPAGRHRPARASSVLHDPWCPPAEIDEVEAAGAIVVRYPDADHGWAQDPTRDNYRAEDAADAWARAIEFLTDGPG